MGNPFVRAPVGGTGTSPFVTTLPGATSNPFSTGLGTGTSPAGGWGKVSGFVQSAVESFPEMFGIEPSENTQAFRASNPVSGFLSEMVGMGGAYGLATKGIKMTPALAGLVERSPAMFGVVAAERPILARGIRWGSEAALIEAGRLGLSATPLPEAVFGKERTEGFGTMALESAANVAIGGALGAGVGAVLSRMQAGPKVFDFVPEAHPSQPLVQRVRGLTAALERGGTPGKDGALVPFPEEVTRDLRHQLEQLKRANFADIEPAYTPNGYARVDAGSRRNFEDGTKLVRPLEDDVIPKSGKSYTDALNTWMSPSRGKPSSYSETLLPVVDPERGFATQRDLDDFWSKAGMDRETAALVGQNHRLIRIKEGQQGPQAQSAATQLENLLTGRRPGTIRTGNPVTRVGDNRFLMREAGDGMWVHAAKVKGSVGKAAPGDEWFIMRSDSPDVLDPQAVKFRETTVDRAAYWPGRETPNIGVGRWDLANTFEKELGALQHIPKGMKPTVSAFKAMGRDVAGDLLAYAQPLVGIMGRNNRANYIGNLLKTLTDAEEGVVGQLLHGARVNDPKKSPFQQVMSFSETSTGGLADFYKTLDDRDWADVQGMLEGRVPYEKMRELALNGHITPKAYEVLDGLENISRANVEEITRLKEHVGASNAKALVDDFTARKGHYGLSEQRDGGFYAIVDDAETGEIRGLFAGNTAGEAKSKAMAAIEKEAKRPTGRNLTYGGMMDDVMESEGRLEQFRSAVIKPGFLRERGDLLGAEIGNGPLNAEKFTQIVERNLKARERFKTNVVLQEKSWYPMQRLAAEDPTVFAQMEKRLAILQGDEGPFAKFQNKAADKVLAPILGTDSATTIVQNTQKMLNAFQFGFGNIAHYALNAISMFQTTFPEAAFVLRTAGRDMSGYVTMPLVDGNGRIIDSVNMLSDVKVFGNALKRVFAPQTDPAWQQLMNDMMSEGLIAPKYAEAHIGAKGAIVKDLQGAWKDGKSFVRWASATNEIGLAKSEEFNRLVGVSTAYEVAKTLGIANDPFRLARFTREFLSKTAFNYTTVDRPTIFTTPIGSLMGTFKTWMFHYMVNMAKYATGAKEGREMWAPLLWQTAATAAIGGTAATPLVKPMADAASKWFTDKPFMEWLYNDALGDDQEMIADGVMYGLPGVMGLSLTAQASTPGADPARDATMLYSFAAFDRMRALGRAVGDGMTAWKATGQSPFEDERTRNELARALAPRTMYRAMSVAEDQAIKSLNTGYRVLDNVSLGDSLLFSLGFNPVELEKTYTAYEDVRKSKEKRREAVSEYGRQLAQAWDNGDDTAASRVFVSAMATGIDTASVLRSAKKRQERNEATQLEFSIGEDKTGEAAESWGFVLDD